jgi:hypothetical protein
MKKKIDNMTNCLDFVSDDKEQWKIIHFPSYYRKNSVSLFYLLFGLSNWNLDLFDEIFVCLFDLIFFLCFLRVSRMDEEMIKWGSFLDFYYFFEFSFIDFTSRISSIKSKK